MRTILRPFLIVVWILVWLTPVTAWADHSLDRPRKREALVHLDRGNQLYAQARWQEAISEYEAGATIEHVPVFEYNLGQCHRKRGDYQTALLHYDRFVTDGQPEGEVLAAVQAFMSEMRAQLANRAMTMPPNDPEPSKPSNTRDEAPQIRAGRTVNEPAPKLGATDTTIRADQPEPTNWLGWTTLGVGVGALGASGYLFLRAASMTDASNSEPDTRARAELRDGARTRNIIGVVTGVAGVALATTGVVLLATHSRRHTRPDTVSFRVELSRQGVTLFGRF